MPKLRGVQIVEAAKQTVYFMGNLCEYTGESEVLYGQLFYRARVLEGRQKGELKDIVQPPENSSGDLR